ncbi:unnamed protein product [Prorocentrum cordatum]|uniref:Uncharacterized protein n=1 Tax=Prorocentrum cordatum TaxID=2364126 RepID=A0ABN9PYH8_9DINO|nr:unnamed protein product [Polarella glacialis]
MAPKKQQKRSCDEVVQGNAELKETMKKMKAEMKDKDSALDWRTYGPDNLKLGLERRRMGTAGAKRLRHVQVQPAASIRNHDQRVDTMQQIAAAESASALARHAMHAAERAAGTQAARATVAACTASAAAAATAEVAPQPIPADYVPPFQRGLQSSSDGVNRIFWETLEVLKGEYLIKLVKNKSPAKFFVHLGNRFGLGLSPRQAHRAGAKICGIGDGKAALTNAFAIEMQVEGPMRQAAVDFNCSVIPRSNGTLAQPTGQEMHLTVGNFSGTIDTQKLFKSKVFKSMIQDGWDWWIISATANRECPLRADLAQKALNANNRVAPLIGEAAAAQMMAGHLKGGDQADDNLEEMAQESVRSMGRPCSPYVDGVTKFVRIYAGGTGDPHIQFIDKVAKKFHATGFWKAVADTTFYDSSGKRPLIRNAMVLANRTSNTMEVGIATLLSRSDAMKLASKANAETAAECKGATGEDARAMELPDIQSQYLDELIAAAGQEVTCDSWGCIVIKKDAAGDPKGLHKLLGFADGAQLQQALSSVHARATDWIKAGLFIATHEVYDAHDDLKFVIRPDVVMAKREFKKGPLALAPMAPPCNISTKKPAGSWGLGKHNAGKQEHFEIKPTRQPATAVIDASYGMSAFWWVKTPADTVKTMGHHGVPTP